MLPKEIKDKMELNRCSTGYGRVAMEIGAQIAFTHQQKAFNEWSDAARQAYEELDAKHQRAMVKLEQLHAARYMAMNLPKSEVADLFKEYKTKHGL